MSQAILERRRELDGFDRAHIVASYFGFRPVPPPKITREDLELVRHCTAHPDYDAVEKMAVIRTYLEENFSSLPHPIGLVYQNNRKRVLGSSRPIGYALHFIGSTSGIVEATLIRTALSILSEEGFKDLKVDVNCVGDRESLAVYERELIQFVRKSGASLPPSARESIKEDIFNLFRLEIPEVVTLSESAPPALTFLSTQARSYFKEVLEYIEALGIDFRLAPKLVGEKNHVSHTIFAVKNPAQSDKVLAVGYRYSRLARLLGLRKEVPMAGVNIFSFADKEARRRIYRELPKPRFYLIQLGREAKIKTLSLIELLRSHKIPLHHHLGRDKIATQLSGLDNLSIPYLIIIGQKEALDNTATIRNVATRAQDTINISDLPRYLKEIRL